MSKQKTDSEIEAERFIDELVGEKKMSLAAVAEIVKAADLIVRVRLREKLRLLEEETQQLRMFVGDDTRQRRRDRTAEDASAMDMLRERGSMTATQLGEATGLGARTNATLVRLQSVGHVEVSGKGRAAVWRIATPAAPVAAAPAPAPAPSNDSAPTAPAPAPRLESAPVVKPDPKRPPAPAPVLPLTTQPKAASFPTPPAASEPWGTPQPD